jgi:hypothetical protein
MACANVFEVAKMFPQPRTGEPRGGEGVQKLAQAVIAAADAYQDKAAPLNEGQVPQEGDVHLMVQVRDSVVQLRELMRFNQLGFENLAMGDKARLISSLDALGIEPAGLVLSQEARLAWHIGHEATNAFDKIYQDSTSPHEKVEACSAALAQFELAAARMEGSSPLARGDAFAQYVLANVAARGAEDRNYWAGSPAS